MTKSTASRTRQNQQPAKGPEIVLRVLETTDVHANLLPYDYFTGKETENAGLARVATLIRQARAEVPNCLLFDTGDFLQGTPISDMTAQPDNGWDKPHPVLTAMNLLKYDAVALGNHEFNFGLDWLHSTLSHAKFPITCANAFTGTQGLTETLFPPYVILDRQIQDTEGKFHKLKIGVIGLLPPQITIWDQFHLQGRVTSRGIVETARALVPEIRARGADLVIALAHTGIEPAPPYPLMENAALPLGSVAGLDAILAGHSHQVFPSPGFGKTPGIDASAATLNGTPTIMAGFGGSHLGVLDLHLENHPGGWRVTGHKAAVQAVQPTPASRPSAPDPALCNVLVDAHKATIKLTNRILGHTTQPLHSYLALLRNDPSIHLIAQAKSADLARHLKGSKHEGLPILAAMAPFKTGGRAGPFYYSDVPPGAFRMRHAADLYSFPNMLCGVRVNGAQLRDWLERATIIFNQIVPGRHDQPLLNPEIPGHTFDVIAGLSYRIDLSQPARYDLSGHLNAPESFRIHDLCHAGKPVRDKTEFIVATNNFRAYGGGPYPVFAESSLVFSGRQLIRDILIEFIEKQPEFPSETPPIWSFLPMPGNSVIFETGPGVRRYPQDTEQLGATDIGDSDTGFARFRLDL